jgi:predicted DNA-binding protein YlxM (UPF0122 family)
LRTWGCRAYALNHQREKDYGHRSIAGIFEVDILWIHEAIERGEFKLLKIETKQQLADIGTKFNIAEIFLYLRSMIMN